MNIRFAAIVCFYMLQCVLEISGSSDNEREVCRSSKPMTLIRSSNIVNVSSLYFDEGDKVNITCIASDAYSGDLNTYLKWIRQNNNTTVPFYNATQKTLHDIRVHNDFCDVEQLHIQYVTTKDQGTYVCIREENQSIIHISLSIFVNEPSAPSVQLNVSEVISKLKNQPIVVICNASGSPLPRIRWMSGSSVTRTCGRSSVCVLKYSALKNSKFTCVASNSYGFTNASFQLQVLVPPVTQIHKSHFYSNILSCSVTRAVPLPTFIWHFQSCNKEMNGCDNDWKSLDDKGFEVHPKYQATNISIVEIKRKDVHGRFRCMALNEAGNATAVMDVSIPMENSYTKFIVWILTAITVIFIIAVVVVIFMRKKICKKAQLFSSNSDYQVKPDVNLMEQGLHLPYDVKWEYPRNRLEFIKVLGSGAFGQVWLARALAIQNWNSEDCQKQKNSIHDLVRKSSRNNNKPNYHAFVAVKTLKDDADESQYKDLASEIKVLIYISKHKNIVNLLGACTKGGSLFAIMEYCPYGDMKNFLKSKRGVFSATWSITDLDSNSTEFTIGDCLSIIYQICKGMEFLHSKKIIHRDLACRNLLVGEQHCIKISDFGLAREVWKDDCYVKTTGGLLPIKWMSPESLFDKVYNVKTDIWSLGIVLWEIFTLGGSPYPGISATDLFTYIERGHRMNRPHSCPSECYEIMQNCWLQDPNERPTFSDIIPKVDTILKENISNHPYLQIINNVEEMTTAPNHYVQTPSVDTRRSKQRFTFSNFIGFLSSKRKPSSSPNDDHLLVRLSSSSKDYP